LYVAKAAHILLSTLSVHKFIRYVGSGLREDAAMHKVSSHWMTPSPPEHPPAYIHTKA